MRSAGKRLKVTISQDHRFEAVPHRYTEEINARGRARRCRMGVLLAGASSVFLAPPLCADELSDALKELQRENAEGTLAILSLAALPDDSASSIFLESGEDDREFTYKSAQLGGGFRLTEDLPIFFEGYIGYARYDPVLLIGGEGGESAAPLKWTSVAATGGVGYQFDLNEHWHFTPMVHLSLGRTQSDASVAAQILAEKLGIDADFLESGGIWAGGVGASASLAYDRRFDSGHELEFRARYTFLHYEPIGDDEDLLVSVDAENAVLWTRYHFPTGWDAFGVPVRGVTDFSISYLAGDQAAVLNTEWLARVGVGLELDVSETWVPWVSGARFMVRYYGSDTVTGYTAGIGISF